MRRKRMPTFRTIALSTIAVLALAVTFALGWHTASHKSRLDTVESGLSDVNDVIAAQTKRFELVERKIGELEAWRNRFGHGQGAPAQ